MGGVKRGEGGRGGVHRYITPNGKSPEGGVWLVLSARGEAGRGGGGGAEWICTRGKRIPLAGDVDKGGCWVWGWSGRGGMS